MFILMFLTLLCRDWVIMLKHFPCMCAKCTECATFWRIYHFMYLSHMMNMYYMLLTNTTITTAISSPHIQSNNLKLKRMHLHVGETALEAIITCRWQRERHKNTLYYLCDFVLFWVLNQNKEVFVLLVY